MSGIKGLSDQIVSFLKDFLMGGPVMASKSLSSLAIVDCGLELFGVLQSMEQFPTGIHKVNFTGNIISAVPQNLGEGLTPKTTLILANCQYSGQAFLDLFLALRSHSRPSVPGDIRIDVSGATFQEGPDGFQPFHKFFSDPPDGEGGSLSLPTLTSLVWDRNPISRANASCFIRFLRQQPKLVSLSLTDCITPSEFPELVHDLTAYFQSANLASFTIAASSRQFAIGSGLASIVDAVRRQRNITAINIAGQQLGEQAILSLVRSLPAGLTELHIDDNGITTPDALIEIIRKLLGSNLRCFPWPSRDYDSVVKLIPHEQRASVLDRLNALQNQYDRMYRNKDANEISKETLPVPDFPVVTVPPSVRPAIEPELEVSESDAELFHVANPDIDRLMDECGLTGLRDPMHTLYRSLQVEFGFEKLSDKLRAKISEKG
jgi:hypothetical protein